MIRKLIPITILLLSLSIPSFARYETGGVLKNIMSNGITLLVYPEPESNFVAIEMFVKVGAEDEDPSCAGIGHLIAGSILSGSEGRAPRKLAKLMSEVGGNFNAVWQWNYMEVSALTTPSMWKQTFGLLADSLQQSTLDQRAIDFSKAAMIKEFSRQDDDLFNAAYTSLRRIIYKGTPYDRLYLGNPSAIKGINQQRLKDFYAQNFTSDRIVISVAGNVNPMEVQERTEIRFGNMKPGRKKLSTNVYSGSYGEIIIQKPGASTYILMGYPAPPVESPDYPAMCVANVILGGYKSSLLFSKFRDDLGLGYEVGSLYPALKGGSHIAAYIGLDSSRADAITIDMIKKTMADQFELLRNGIFSAEDIERAKRYLIGSHALDHERIRDRAYNLGWHEVMGLGYQSDFLFSKMINQVTSDDVMQVCQKYFSKPSYVVLKGSNENGSNVASR